MLKREWGAESNGKLPQLFIPSKTATLVPEFAVEAELQPLVPEFAARDLPLSRTLWFYWHKNYNDPLYSLFIIKFKNVSRN